MSHNAEWEAEQAKKLIGYTIVGAVTDRSKDPTYWGLQLQRVQHFGRTKVVEPPIVVWVDSDCEGNDCGHLNISALKEKA